MNVNSVVGLAAWFSKAKSPSIDTGKELELFANQFIEEVILSPSPALDLVKLYENLVVEFRKQYLNGDSQDTTLFIFLVLSYIVGKLNSTQETGAYISHFVREVCFPLLSVVNLPKTAEEQKLTEDIPPGLVAEAEELNAVQRQACHVLANVVARRVDEQTTTSVLQTCERVISSPESSEAESGSSLSMASVIYLLSSVFRSVSASEDIRKFEERLFTMLLKTLKNFSVSHRKLILKKLFPHFFEGEAATVSKRLHELWGAICEWNKPAHPLRADSYALVCQFYEKFFKNEGGKFMVDLRGEPAFWDMIFSGLQEIDITFTRKRCSYLLRRVIDTSATNPTIGPQQGWTKFFKWSPELAAALDKQWQFFFLVFEALDNHAVHLIQPVWIQMFVHMLPKHMDNDDEHLDFSWIKMILLKAFNHANFSVVRLALISVYEVNFSLFKPFVNQEFVCKQLIEYSGEPRLYYKRGRIGDRLVAFYHNYIKAIPESMRADVINEILKHMSPATNRAPAAYILKMLSTLQLEKPVLGDREVETLYQVIDKHSQYHSMWMQNRHMSCIVDILINNSSFKALSFQAVLKLLAMINSSIFEIPALLAKLRTWITAESTLEEITKLMHDVVFEAIKETNFSTAAQNLHRMARFVRIVAPLLSAEHADAFLAPIVENMSKMYKHAYLHKSIPLKCILAFSSLVDELQDSDVSVKKLIIPQMLQHADEIISYCVSKITFPDDLDFEKYASTAASEEATFKEDVTEAVAICSEGISALLRVDREAFTKTALELLTKATLYLKIVNQAASTNDSRLSSNILVANIATTNALEITRALLKSSVKNILSIPPKQMEETLAVVFPLNFLRKNATESSQAAEKLTSLTPTAITDIAFYAKWECIQIALQMLTAANALSTLSLVSKEEVLEGTVEALDFIKVDDMPVVVDSLRLLLPVVAPSTQKLSQICDAALTALKQTDKKREVECYFSFVNGILSCKYIFTNAQALQEIIKKKLFKSILKTSERAARTIIPLTFMVSSIVQRRNEPAKLQLVDEVMELLLHFLEVNDDEELEATAYGLSGSSYSLMHPAAFPEIFKVTKISKMMLHFALSQLRPKEDETDQKFVNTLIKKLLAINFTPAIGKMISMPSSIQHKKKLSIWKTLLLMSHFIDAKIAKDIFADVWKMLYLNNNLSVKRLVETFIFTLAQRFPEYTDELEKMLNQTGTRGTHLNSLVILAGQLLVNCRLEQLPTFFRKLYRYMVLYQPSHNHAVRVGAQLFLDQSYKRIQRDASYLLDEQGEAWHRDMKRLFEFISLSENNQKFIAKNKEDIYNPLDLLQPEKLLGQVLWEANQIIDDHLPLLYFKMFAEQKMNLLFYSLCSASGSAKNFDLSTCYIRIDDMLREWNSTVEQNKDIIPKLNAPTMKQFEEELNLVRNHKEQFFTEEEEEKKKSVNAYQAQKMNNRESTSAATTTSKQEEDENEGEEKQVVPALNQEAELLTFQRKILVWKDMELEGEINPRSQLATRNRQSIIVMASYVDRMPNIAGLSRTCEIFKAEKLLIHSKKTIEHDEFKSISVSAHLWLPIEECPEPQMMDYLKAKKIEGYTIVGVEQTSSSVSIEKFSFPERCVIVLGKEKEGIPTELLQAIDVCVEIPQFGIIRSLNVHVSASIMLFEYTRQQILRKRIGQ